MVCCYCLLSVLMLLLSVPLWYDFGRYLQKGACTVIQVDVHKMAVLLSVRFVGRDRGKGD